MSGHYKNQFIDFLLETGSLRFGDFTLKSGRKSPYFIQTGQFNDGEAVSKLGRFYAASIVDNFDENSFDIIFGPAYKGIPISVATTISLYRDFGINKGYAFDRKEAKNHGEASQQDAQSRYILGSEIKDGAKILLVDDVLTTARTKRDSINLLNSIAKNLYYAGLVIAVDRQEVNKDGSDAVSSFELETGMRAEAIVTTNDIVK